MFNDVVIVAAGRTAVGAFGGALAGIPASELGARVIKGLLARANLTAEQIDEVEKQREIKAPTNQIEKKQKSFGCWLHFDEREFQLNEAPLK